MRFFVLRMEFCSIVENAMMMNTAWEPPIYMKQNAAPRNFVKKVTTKIRSISIY